MAKDRKPAEDLSAFANQGMAQARNAVDTYFDFLKIAVSSTRRVEQSSVKGSRAIRIIKPRRDLRICPAIEPGQGPQ